MYIRIIRASAKLDQMDLERATDSSFPVGSSPGLGVGGRATGLIRGDTGWARCNGLQFAQKDMRLPR